MTIRDLKREEWGEVLAVSSPEQARVRVLGIRPGARIVLLSVSPLKHTYVLGTEAGKVAISAALAPSGKL